VLSQLNGYRMLRSRFLGIGACVSLGALVVAGCGGEKSETPAATAPAPTVAKPEAPAVVEEVWTTTLPEDFPQDLPQYPGANVVKANSVPGSDIKVAFSTTDDVGKVAAYFNDSLAAQGWTTQRVDGQDGTLVFAEKGERSATYAVASAEGKTTIDLLVVEMQ
jgi:hypothetical protein